MLISTLVYKRKHKSVPESPIISKCDSPRTLEPFSYVRLTPPQRTIAIASFTVKRPNNCVRYRVNY